MVRPRSLPVRVVLLALPVFGCGRDQSSDRTSSGTLTPESFARPAEHDAEQEPLPALVVPADAPLVVFLGDSIASGLHLAPEQAFPALLQRTLAAEELPFRLVNAGVSGDTSAGGLRRLDWLLQQDPDVLVLELGGNDGLRGLPVGEIEARLHTIVARAQAAGARVLLLGVRLPPSLGADYVRAFEALYPRLAAELGCAFVPFFMEGAAGEREKMLSDGIHPNARGHERLAANVAPALRESLRPAAALLPGSDE